MDYQEAIELLKGEIKCSYYRNRGYCGICTIYSEMDRDKIIHACKCAISAIQELQEYKQLGTLEEVREAVEKQRTKKPTYDGDGYAPDGTFVWDEWICHHCGSRFEVDYDDYDYCPNCGQHIDWSEEE